MDELQIFINIASFWLTTIKTRNQLEAIFTQSAIKAADAQNRLDKRLPGVTKSIVKELEKYQDDRREELILCCTVLSVATSTLLVAIKAVEGDVDNEDD